MYLGSRSWAVALFAAAGGALLATVESATAENLRSAAAKVSESAVITDLEPAQGKSDQSALSIAWEESTEGIVNGFLSVQGDLAALAATLSLEEQRLGGLANVEFSVAGPVSAPLIRGNGRIVGGVYEHYVGGTLIRDLVVDASARPGGDLLVGLRGNDGEGGIIEGNANVRMRRGGNVGIEGTVDLTNATILRRDDITAKVSGSVTYSGSPVRGRVVGKLNASRVLIRLARPLPESVVSLQVVEIGELPNAPTLPQDQNEKDRWVGDLDLIVTMPGGVFVSGGGFFSEWRGLMHVTGTTDSPELEGILQAMHGRITFAGSQFALGEGVMEFNGRNGVDPLLHLVATHDLKDLTVFINVTGWSSNPTIKLTSQPNLPEDEILARVIFGKSVSRLTSGETMRLASALKILARGESPKIGIEAFVDRIMGIDVLASERQRRLAGDLGLTRRQDRWDEEQFGSKTSEIEISAGVSVAGEVAEEENGLEGGKFGLLWKWDY